MNSVCILYIVYTLYIIHDLVYSIQCILYIVLCIVYTVDMTMYSIHCRIYTIYNVLYKLSSIWNIWSISTAYTILCIVNSIHYTMYSVHNTMRHYVMYTTDNILYCILYTIHNNWRLPRNLLEDYSCYREQIWLQYQKYYSANLVRLFEFGSGAGLRGKAMR